MYLRYTVQHVYRNLTNSVLQDTYLIMYMYTYLFVLTVLRAHIHVYSPKIECI